MGSKARVLAIGATCQVSGALVPLLAQELSVEVVAAVRMPGKAEHLGVSIVHLGSCFGLFSSKLSLVLCCTLRAQFSANLKANGVREFCSARNAGYKVMPPPNSPLSRQIPPPVSLQSRHPGDRRSRQGEAPGANESGS